jgi:hypothetical protein
MGRTACTEPQCLYNRAIPLLPLWAVRPVQSLSACTVELYLYFPMGRTACTEPLCLYKGALYLYLYLTLAFVTLMHSRPKKYTDNGGMWRMKFHTVHWSRNWRVKCSLVGHKAKPQLAFRETLPCFIKQRKSRLTLKPTWTLANENSAGYEKRMAPRNTIWTYFWV